jgi:hypothetical protein
MKFAHNISFALVMSLQKKNLPILGDFPLQLSEIRHHIVWQVQGKLLGNYTASHPRRDYSTCVRRENLVSQDNPRPCFYRTGHEVAAVRRPKDKLIKSSVWFVIGGLVFEHDPSCWRWTSDVRNLSHLINDPWKRDCYLGMLKQSALWGRRIPLQHLFRRADWCSSNVLHLRFSTLLCFIPLWNSYRNAWASWKKLESVQLNS